MQNIVSSIDGLLIETLSFTLAAILLQLFVIIHCGERNRNIERTEGRVMVVKNHKLSTRTKGVYETVGLNNLTMLLAWGISALLLVGINLIAIDILLSNQHTFAGLFMIALISVGNVLRFIRIEKVVNLMSTLRPLDKCMLWDEVHDRLYVAGFSFKPH